MKVNAICLLMIVLAGCSGLDEEDFANERKVVIDGFIEQGEYPVVYLTYSSGFFEPVDSASLQELVLTTARVEVSDGERSEVLTLFRNKEIYPPFFYRATDIRGEAGKTYTLEVRSRQGIYTATTSIPDPVALDSVWIEVNEEVDTLGNLWIRFFDDPRKTDYYRNFVQVRGKDEDYVPAYQSTVSDRTFNGQMYSHPVLQLPESFMEIDDDVLFVKGDTIRIRFCAIDAAHFDFWRTLEREVYLVGNPFGSSGNDVQSNIRGNQSALGIWGGYGATYQTIIFQ